MRFIHRLLSLCASYFDVIKSPMDLSTMGSKLDSGAYPNRDKFEADFRLMIANAKEYNLSGSYGFNEAVAIETFFDKRKHSRLV
jgi:transcription initiation factor TFIID subunit 2